MVRGFSCASVLFTFLFLRVSCFVTPLLPSLPLSPTLSTFLSRPLISSLFLPLPLSSLSLPTFLITVQIIANFFCLHTNKQNKIYINILSNFSFIRISGYKRWTRLPPPREYSFLEMSAIIPKMMVSLLYIWGGERGKEG